MKISVDRGALQTVVDSVCVNPSNASAQIKSHQEKPNLDIWSLCQHSPSQVLRCLYRYIPHFLNSCKFLVCFWASPHSLKLVCSREILVMFCPKGDFVYSRTGQVERRLLLIPSPLRVGPVTCLPHTWLLSVREGSSEDGQAETDALAQKHIPCCVQR